jgi:hypothetical protein
MSSQREFSKRDINESSQRQNSFGRAHAKEFPKEALKVNPQRGSSRICSEVALSDGVFPI